ncbi:MAG: Dam family site-specific DNA-(adenine-N6)-methyltransferase [Cyanobacteria bacterium P01_H01_bin.15]
MKPFLKWAGGKYKLADYIKSILPSGARLIEPFVGSGAIFLNVSYPRYFLADANPDLIELYQQLQKEGAAFIEFVGDFFGAEFNQPERYYKLRERFNQTDNPREKSALFVYLNKHCFNGLCRYNASGKFNVPFGQYKRPYFPAKEMLYFHQRSQNAIFCCQDFVTTLQQAQAGDVVYCDPPYVPLSLTANFTSYSAGKFGEREQRELAKQAKRLATQNIPVMISNHDTDFTREIYDAAVIYDFKVQRNISREGKNRTKVSELLAFFRTDTVISSSII